MPTPTSEARGNATLVIDGVTIPGPWEKHEGGDVTAPDVKFAPGGMLPEVSLGGTASKSNITLTKAVDLDTDLDLYPWLEARAGIGRATIGRVFLGADRRVVGSLANTGTFLNVSLTAYDASSTKQQELVLEFSIAGP
jgi:hypothetical protein